MRVLSQAGHARRDVVVAICLAASMVAAPVAAQIPAKKQERPFLIRNATIHSVASPAQAGASLLVVDGKIAAIGTEVEAPENATIVDAKGQHVWPAMIAANSLVGLTEIESVRATRDFDEAGDVTPELRAEVAFHPDSALIPVTRAGGVGYVCAVPSGGLVSGRSALMRLDGWTWEDMSVRAPVGLHVRWPRMKIPHGEGAAKARAARDADLRALEKLIEAARAHAARGGKGDARLDALRPVVEGRVRVFVHAESLRQIEAALDWTRRAKLAMVLVGGRDAGAVAGELRERKIPVIVPGIHRLPAHRMAAYDVRFTLPRRLAAANVDFCIAGIGSSFEAAHERNLPYHAATAVAHGLDPARGIAAITRDAARILGVGDRLGTLEVGKDASLILCDGNPLEMTTRVLAMWLEGRAVDLDSRHEQLRRKYEEKHRRAGR